MTRRTIDADRLLVNLCGLMTSLRVLDDYLTEGEKQNPDHRLTSIGIFPVMSFNAAFAVELLLKFAYECDHGEPYPIQRGTRGHNLEELFDKQEEARQCAINQFYLTEYKKMKHRNISVHVGLQPATVSDRTEYHSVWDVVKGEADTFLEARYYAEMSHTNETVTDRFSTNPYHLWALAKGIFYTIDWGKRLRSDSILVITGI